ncbi:hypothetical protein MKQ70_32470 [Chitinophaga sedimenti]|uniref:hypothetical protein n=1 Tax=Chitinophaga sedimenti TaxID=2033606 RepID=UPI002006CB17|nr:hypothetical protein [Chitinophaga sedimenti]MCK7559432.1 hypothetical protein [Chitinophaga sedimenti]
MFVIMDTTIDTHLKDFCRLMQHKGYHNRFVISDASGHVIDDFLRLGLYKYFRLYPPGGAKTKLQLNSYLQHKSQSNYIMMRMEISYDADNGIKINKVTLHQKNLAVARTYRPEINSRLLGAQMMISQFPKPNIIKDWLKGNGVSQVRSPGSR